MYVFELLWLRWLLVTILLGLGGALAVVLGVHLLSRRSRPAEVDEGHEYAAGIRTGEGRVPALLIVLYVAVLVYIAVYTAYALLGKVSY
jgi:hypothetical protein